MKLSFWGAARQVTGSMYLLETDDDLRILIDCGADMEQRDMPEKQFGLFPFDVSSLHAVLLTHAHIDHSGYLPNLLREGFEGQIYCTAPTYALSKILLEDAAALNLSKLKRAQAMDKKRRLSPKDKEYMRTLYAPRQVEDVLENFSTIPFHQRTRLARGVYFTFIPAGHLLGAAHIVVEIEEGGRTKRIGFSGDLGRADYPLLIDPEPMPSVDVLLCESTYGNRQHYSEGKPEEEVLRIIQNTCVERAGRLIVPAFSVGRTQAMLYTLHKLKIQGKLPPIKIFTDSPLALQSTRVYQRYTNWLNAEAQEFAEAHGSLFDFDNLVYLETLAQSKAIAHYHEPYIVISSSGMIQGGRIEHHVKENLQNPNATILLIGYAAEGTLGHALAHGQKVVHTKKRDIPVQARVVAIDVFSGHGDLDDLLGFVRRQAPQHLERLFLIHGDYGVMQDFQKTLISQGYPQTEIPKRGDSFVW